MGKVGSSSVRNLGLLALLGLAFATQGCAILVRGDVQDVTLTSTVAEGLRVEVDGKPAKLGTVELDRGRIHVIYAEAPGHDSLEVTVHPFINDDWLFAEQCTMWPILWLPMAVDYNTGSLHDLPETIDLNLTKTKEAPPTPAGTAAAPAETRKRVIKKVPPQPVSIRENRTAHFGENYVKPEN